MPVIQFWAHVFSCHLWITFKATRKKHQHKVSVKHLEIRIKRHSSITHLMIHAVVVRTCSKLCAVTSGE